MTRTTERALLLVVLPWIYPIGCRLAARIANRHYLEINL